MNDRIRWDQLRRRSSAAGPHKSKRRDDEWELVELEAEIEVWEPEELNDRRTAG